MHSLCTSQRPIRHRSASSVCEKCIYSTIVHFAPSTQFIQAFVLHCSWQCDCVCRMVLLAGALSTPLTLTHLIASQTEGCLAGLPTNKPLTYSCNVWYLITNTAPSIRRPAKREEQKPADDDDDDDAHIVNHLAHVFSNRADRDTLLGSAWFLTLIRSGSYPPIHCASSLTGLIFERRQIAWLALVAPLHISRVLVLRSASLYCRSL